ncbi:MAG TPA: MFS transporter [Candidatus Limnocylindria bacterium]|nr:MFS transporter [Candidatus Limnocylindria bacterium]
MLASGVAAGIAAAIAFGGDWRRLATFSLRFWPLLIVASAIRLVASLSSAAPLGVYLVALVGIAAVAALNWRLPGASLIAIGTAMNILVVALNSGMPYDGATVSAVGAPPPTDSLHTLMGPGTRLPFLGDIVPVGVVRSVYSVGDFLIALGGFLIPFMWLQSPVEGELTRYEVRSPNFAFFWLAQVISRFGDPITLVALTYVTYRQTHSALLTAVAVVIATIPNAVFGFFGGAVADAVGHRRAMLWCDIIRAALISTIPVLLGLQAPLALVFVVVLLAGVCGAVFGPARIAIIPALLSPDRLAAGNSLVTASDRAVEIGGALAGGVLVATAGENAFFVDAATFAISALLLLRVVVAETSHRLTWLGLLADAREGLVFLRRSATLWSNTLFSLAGQVSNPVINGLTPAFLVGRFASGDVQIGAVEYGAAEAAIAFGAVVASVTLPASLSRVRKGRLLIIGFASTGAVIMLIALAPSFPVALALFALLGVTNIVYYVPTVTILQEGTPQDMRARVFGARIAITNLSWLPIIFVSGTLADAVGPAPLILAAGGLTLATAVFAARFVPAVSEVA